MSQGSVQIIIDKLNKKLNINKHIPILTFP